MAKNRIEAGDKYYYIDLDGRVVTTSFSNCYSDDFRIKFGNYFTNKVKAETMLKKIKKLLKEQQ